MPKRSTKKPAPDRKRLTRSIADSAHASGEPDVAPEPPRKKPAAKKRR